MGLLTRIMAIGPPPEDDFWYRPFGFGSPTQAGVGVDADSAMRLSAVYACVKVLAETVASLPLIVYRNRPDGGKERARDHPLFDLMHDRPNRWQTSFEWREMMMGHLVLRGNAYSEMLAGPRGFASELMPLHPDRIKVDLMPDRMIRYRHREADGTERVILQDRMFHLRGLSSNGLTGISVIGLARESIGLGLATEGYGARLFSQAPRPSGVIEHPMKLTKEASKRIAATFQDATTGLDQAHKAAILDEGMKWHQIGMTAEDSQFLETRKWQVRDIARWFRMQPHKIQDLENATFTNIEQQAIEHVVDTIRPWLVRWEQRIKTDLILEGQSFFVEFLVDALLRGDTESRFKAYATARQWGWFSVNDILRLENRNPIDGGDIYLQPMNMIPAPTGQTAQLRTLAAEAAGRAARRELEAVGRRMRTQMPPGEMADWLESYYGEHAEFLVRTLHVPETDARAYAFGRLTIARERGLTGLEEDAEAAIGSLVELMLEGRYAAA